MVRQCPSSSALYYGRYRWWGETGCLLVLHTEVKANLCVPRPLELKVKEIRGVLVSVMSLDYTAYEDGCLLCCCATNSLPPSSGRPNDRGRYHAWHVGRLLPDYTAQRLRKQPTSGLFASVNLRPIAMVWSAAQEILITERDTRLWYLEGNRLACHPPESCINLV
jgi:hypothetical protein